MSNPPDGDTEARLRTGKALEARREELNPRWANRRVFSRETGVNYKQSGDIENAYRSNFGAPALAQFAAAYQVTYESLRAALDGTGELVPAGESRPPAQAAGDWRPEALAQGYGVQEILAAEKLRPAILLRLRALGATPPDQAGDGLFPGDARSAAAWNAAWSASSEDPATRAEQVALIVALQQVRRSAAERGTRGA